MNPMNIISKVSLSNGLILAGHGIMRYLFGIPEGLVHAEDAERREQGIGSGAIRVSA